MEVNVLVEVPNLLAMDDNESPLLTVYVVAVLVLVVVLVVVDVEVDAFS